MEADLGKKEERRKRESVEAAGRLET